MMTLRELRDDPNRNIDEELCAQILQSVLRSDVVPLSPDDVIADPDQDVFEVRRSSSGDFSFASPQVLMDGREPDDKDRQYALGMVIHYLWCDEYQDLAIVSRMPLVRLYAVNDEQESPLLRDAHIRSKLGNSGNNTLLKLAIALTGGDANRRTRAKAEIERWILGIESQVTFRLMEDGGEVGQYEYKFKNPRGLKIEAGRVLSCKGARYRFLEDRIIEFRPGRRTLEIAVERVR